MAHTSLAQLKKVTKHINSYISEQDNVATPPSRQTVSCLYAHTTDQRSPIVVDFVVADAVPWASGM